MLASTVEYLLTKHNCVIVPGLGAFLLQEFSAKIGLGGEIIPPGMKVVFNPELQHNDGLIVSYWMQKMSVPGAEAQYRLKRAVSELYRKVEEKEFVRFGILGQLSLTAEGAFFFDNSKQSYITPSYMGLKLISMPLLQPEKESIRITRSKAKSKNRSQNGEAFVRVQINFRPKRLLRKTASWAAAIVLLFCCSSPFGSDNYNATQKAALGLPDLFQRNHRQSTNSSSEAAATAEQTDTIQTSTKGFTIEPSKQFYIIISSCHSVAVAEKELKVWETRYPQAGIVERNGRGRVYAYVYTDRSEAEKRLNEVRKSEKSDAWLFIKNK